MTVFSFGAGQESFAILLMIIFNKDFREKYVKGTLIVVGSDTGDEHPHTYETIERARVLCKEHGIEFYWVTADMGFHPKTWQSLFAQYRKTSTIGSAAFQQTCTDNLKVKVVDNFVENWIKGKLNSEASRKKSYYQMTEVVGDKIRLILGFAKGEEKRTSKGNKYDAIWKKANVERCFPLIIEGLDRQACIDINTSYNFEVWPSNCMRCFYQSDQEVLWLFRFHPEKFWEWVDAEKNKKEKWKHRDLEEPPTNYGVYGKITLEQKLEKAQKLYGHWTDEELNEYKFSHGHCIKSKY